MEARRDDLRFTPSYSSDHTLEDGTKVRLRLLRPDDRGALLAGFQRLSPESRYFRFFTAMPKLPSAVVDDLMNTDGWNRLAIAAQALNKDGRPEGVGIARLTRLKDVDDAADAAVAVVDHMQRRGLGRLLLSALTAAARERGIKRFRTQVLRTNDAMLGLLRDLDKTAKPASFDGPVAYYDLELPSADAERNANPLFDFLKLAASGLEVVMRGIRGTLDTSTNDDKA